MMLGLLAILSTLIVACSQDAMGDGVAIQPLAFEVESADAATGGAWALRPDPQASAQMAVVAASAGSVRKAISSDARLPFDLEAPGGYVAHLRVWVPSGSVTTVGFGIDGAPQAVAVTDFDHYTWIATEVAELEPGTHHLTLGAPPVGVRYDLAVVSHGALSVAELNTFGDFDATEPEPGTPVFPAGGAYPVRDASLYGPVLEWSVHTDDVQGNRFDATAKATFVHQDGERITTELFYDGDDVYRFRFSATRPGLWTFATSSDVTDLNGLTGAVHVVPTDDPSAYGFYQAAGDNIAVPVGNDGHLQGIAYQIYMHADGALQQIGLLPADPVELRKAVDEGLDRAEEQGFNAVFVGVYDNWFKFGARNWGLHSSTDPDPVTFRVLETIITRARARGIGVHLWMWGDEELKMTPVGVGGIGGTSDLRLQRYIAARLGPLPGWTMGYGFDLNEWVTPSQVREWEANINALSGWSHILTAREAGDFSFGQKPLAVASNDLRPLLDHIGTYRAAIDAFAQAKGRPIIFERRFMYRRDDLWSMDATRRGMWQFTMAGGAASIWGTQFGDSTPYPKPGQLRAFREFWRSRLDVDLAPGKGADGTLLLAAPDGRRVIAYAEDTRRVTLPVVPGGHAVALDTRAETYEEIPVEPPATDGTWTWEAPHRSDWAIAFTAP